MEWDKLAKEVQEMLQQQPAIKGYSGEYIKIDVGNSHSLNKSANGIIKTDGWLSNATSTLKKHKKLALAGVFIGGVAYAASRMRSQDNHDLLPQQPLWVDRVKQSSIDGQVYRGNSS